MESVTIHVKQMKNRSVSKSTVLIFSMKFILLTVGKSSIALAGQGRFS